MFKYALNLHNDYARLVFIVFNFLILNPFLGGSEWGGGYKAEMYKMCQIMLVSTNLHFRLKRRGFGFIVAF